MKKIVIAIDGYSACGKSTLARQLASRLHYTYIDSGAMYRAITLYFIRHHLDPNERSTVTAALNGISLEFIPNAETANADMWLNGENVEQGIREISVAARVSEIAAIAEVRAFAVGFQRNMRKDTGIVMDGRDVGTVVFPDAELKIFMTADMEIRVARRYKEMMHKRQNVSLQEVRENIAQRDYTDTHRAIGPLRQAEDAIVIDNTDLTPEQQLAYALKLVKAITG